MNYFEFFDLSVGLDIDVSKLRTKFLLNSKKFHPDHQDQSNAAALEEALDKSAQNNKAYQTLLNEDLRIKHILDIEGLLNKENEKALPQEFLFEMMDLNEGIMEAKINPSLKGEVESKITSFEKELSIEFQKLSNIEFSKIDTSILVTFYLKNKYLRRLKENLNSESPEI